MLSSTFGFSEKIFFANFYHFYFISHKTGISGYIYFRAVKTTRIFSSRKENRPMKRKKITALMMAMAVMATTLPVSAFAETTGGYDGTN